MPWNRPPLSVTQILAWADAQREVTGEWPRHDTGEIAGTQETWAAVEAALVDGYRGLRGGDSLYSLLNRYRRIPGRRSKLTMTMQRGTGPSALPRGVARDATRREKAVELRNEGLTQAQIAEKLGCTHQGVSYLLKTTEQEVGQRRKTSASSSQCGGAVEVGKLP